MCNRGWIRGPGAEPDHPGSLFRDPFRPAVQEKTVATFDATGNRTGTVVTTEPGGGSLIERSLASGGVLLLRLAVVAAAAYLAGALVFRTLSGTFPSEIGGVKFAEEAAVGLDKLTSGLKVVGDEVAELTARLQVTETELGGMRTAAAGGAYAVSQLGQRLDEAEDGIEQLAQAVVALANDLAEIRGRQGQ